MLKIKSVLLCMLVAFQSHAEIELYADETKSVLLTGGVDTYADLFRESESDNPEQEKNEDFDLYIEAYAEFQYSHQLTDGLMTFGAFEVYSFEDEFEERTTELDDVYIGVSGQFGSLYLGEAEDSVDVVGLLTDISNDGVYAIDSLYEEEGLGVKYEYIYNDTFLFSADMQDSGEEDVDREYSVAISYQTDSFNVSAMYTDAGDFMGFDLNAYAVGAAYRNETFYVGAIYSDYNGPYSQGNGYFMSGQSWSLAGSYTMNGIRGYTTVLLDNDEDSNASATAYTIGVDYLVHEDMLIFAEYTGSSHDVDDWTTSSGVVGVFYKF